MLGRIGLTLESFLAAVGRSSAKTAEGYGLSVRRFARAFGRAPDEIVEDLKAGRLDVVDFLRRLNEWSVGQGHRSTTTLLYLTGWLQFLRWEKIPVNRDVIKAEVRPPRKVKSLGARPFTRTEITKVLNLVNHKYRTMILLAATSGLRAGEIGALRVRDIDFSKSPVELSVRGESSKSGRGRVAFCSDEAAAHLKALMGEKADGNDFIFSMHGGRFTSDAITAATSRILRRAELRERDGDSGRHILSFHSLRKFFTTHMVEAGVPLPIVELMCGREIGTTQSYLMPNHNEMRTYYADTMQKLVLTQAEATVGSLRETFVETEKRMRMLEEREEKVKQELEQRDRTIEKLSRYIEALEPHVPALKLERLRQDVLDRGFDPDEVIMSEVLKERKKMSLMTVKKGGKTYPAVPVSGEECIKILQRFLKGQLKRGQPSVNARVVRRIRR